MGNDNIRSASSNPALSMVRALGPPRAQYLQVESGGEHPCPPGQRNNRRVRLCPAQRLVELGQHFLRQHVHLAVVHRDPSDRAVEIVPNQASHRRPPVPSRFGLPLYHNNVTKHRHDSQARRFLLCDCSLSSSSSSRSLTSWRCPFRAPPARSDLPLGPAASQPSSASPTV